MSPTTAAPQVESDVPMVVLVGGPLDRRWYWREDFTEQLHAAQQSQPIRSQRGVSADAVLAYHPTERTVANPIARYGPGQVWTYSQPAHSTTQPGTC